MARTMRTHSWASAHDLNRGPASRPYPAPVVHPSQRQIRQSAEVCLAQDFRVVSNKQRKETVEVILPIPAA
jgi:hypothetical protein